MCVSVSQWWMLFLVPVHHLVYTTSFQQLTYLYNFLTGLFGSWEFSAKTMSLWWNKIHSIRWTHVKVAEHLIRTIKNIHIWILNQYVLSYLGKELAFIFRDQYPQCLNQKSYEHFFMIRSPFFKLYFLMVYLYQSCYHMYL